MRRAPQGNIELVPEKQVLDLNLAPRAERVDDQHRKQMTECKHHSDDALILPHCANPLGCPKSLCRPHTAPLTGAI
jgi:hypothetical protein